MSCHYVAQALDTLFPGVPLHSTPGYARCAADAADFNRQLGDRVAVTWAVGSGRRFRDRVAVTLREPR